MPSAPPALGRRLRTHAEGLWREVGSLRTPRRSVLRTPRDRVPPRPLAFARFGDRSWVVPPAEIHGPEGIEVGDDVIILEHVSLVVTASHGASLRIGDRVRLARGVHIRCMQSVELGPAVSTSDHASISDTWSPNGHVDPDTASSSAPVVIEAGAYLGFGSFIGPGVRVGTGAYVGEGAVVLDDVQPHTVVFGNPAKAVRTYRVATGSWDGARFP